jgi:hypothetical protein
MSDPKGGSGHLWVKGRLAAQYLPGCLTHIRTVEVEPYAAGSICTSSWSPVGVYAQGRISVVKSTVCT